MDDKITIIEGPPPTFQLINDGWALGLSDSAQLSSVAVTQLRTVNGPALVERCYRTWRNLDPIHLEYRQPDGLQNQAPILAARNVETPEGHLLILWVRIPKEEANMAIGYDDTSDDGNPPR